MAIRSLCSGLVAISYPLRTHRHFLDTKILSSLIPIVTAQGIRLNSLHTPCSIVGRHCFWHRRHRKMIPRKVLERNSLRYLSATRHSLVEMNAEVYESSEIEVEQGHDIQVSMLVDTENRSVSWTYYLTNRARDGQRFDCTSCIELLDKAGHVVWKGENEKLIVKRVKWGQSCTMNSRTLTCALGPLKSISGARAIIASKTANVSIPLVSSNNGKTSNNCNVSHGALGYGIAMNVQGN